MNFCISLVEQRTNLADGSLKIDVRFFKNVHSIYRNVGSSQADRQRVNKLPW